MKSSSVFRFTLTFFALALALAPFAAAQSVESFTYSYTGNAIPILVDDANVASVIGIGVPRSIKIQKVTVKVDVDYPNPSDLNVYLYSPNGTRVKLVERNCNEEATLRQTTFDDDAPEAYRDFCPSQPGKVGQGNEPLANTRDQNAAGAWLLAVENNGSNDHFGWVLGFSVTITGEVYSEPTTTSQLIVSAASLAGGGVAPGELISIYGVNIGPSDPVRAPKGDLPTSLGGTEVSVNEQKAPILYASKYRVDVQMPYALGVPGDVWITVNRNGQSSAPANLPVVATKPGLFSVNPTGIGQLEATNADGTSNKDQAAQRGSEITVYASGLGYTVPPIPAGQSPTTKPLALAYYPVTARVGGVEATVLGATLVLDRPGVYAVRIMIPTTIGPGTTDVMIASVSAASQPGAFIRVR